MAVKGYTVPLYCDIIGFLVFDNGYELVFSLPGEDGTLKMELGSFLDKFCKLVETDKEDGHAEER